MSERNASTSAHIRTFLEMLAAEKGAARNTLDAYARDLDDLAGFLAGRDRALLETTPPISPPTSATSRKPVSPLPPARAKNLRRVPQLFR